MIQDKGYLLNLLSVFEEATFGIAFIDPEGNWKKGNSNFLHFTGCSEEDFSGFTWDDVFEKNESNTGFSSLITAASSRFSPVVLKVLRKDGRRVWLNVFLLRLENKHLACIAEDISREMIFKELDQLERNVLEKNALPYYRLEEVLDEFIRGLEQIFPETVCSIMKVSDGKVYCWSAKGLPEDYLREIEGASIGPKAGSCGTAAFFKTAVIVEDISTDYRWEPYKSTIISHGYKACWSTPILSASGKVLATFAIYYKKVKSPESQELNFINRSGKILAIILENYLSIQSLKQSNQRFQYVTEATSEAIWDADLRKGTVVWSQGYQTLFGHPYQQEEMDGSSWSDYIHPDDYAGVTGSIERIIDSRKKTWTQAYRFRKADGSYLRVEDKGLVVRDPEGKPLRMVGAMRDISTQYAYNSSLKELNRSLEASKKHLEATNAELEQYAFIASHHLQEPLRMVIGFMDKLYKSYGSELDDKASRYVLFALNGAIQMRQQILDLQEYGAIGKNETNAQFRWLETSQLVTDALRVNSEFIQQTSAIIEFGNLPRIWGDKRTLIQVFEHLILNGIKYQPPSQKARIVISSQKKDGETVIYVQDNGLGIDKAYHEKIFLLFQRLHGKDAFPGTGIGLSLCKKIIEHHGGTIWLESEVGKGSTFYFTIPEKVD
ncbi:ATP-binding protein [Cyclobacterium jeungdonense]|uniref:histidine kinase n=1 Tax=Cyclobacterium jeungdonense TaxID=708087 RepID=A0ABT8CA76_9BACT|nr:ATP-binding protein [Cyclobacterium jeungdonense]MDN3689252.1 PAS domain S-box protein [Cyclobacterium jeungdonense]